MNEKLYNKFFNKFRIDFSSANFREILKEIFVIYKIYFNNLFYEIYDVYIYI